MRIMAAVFAVMLSMLSSGAWAASASQQGDNILVSSEPSGTYGPYNLIGGVYGITLVMTGSGALNVNRLGPDGATYVAVITGLSGAGNSYTVICLPPGVYQVVGTGTANSASVAFISSNRTSG